jgi:hypothetical protein
MNTEICFRETVVINGHTYIYEYDCDWVLVNIIEVEER